MKKKAKGKPSAPEADVERVVLRPVLGMKPGAYLSVLYGLIILLILFLLLFLPGIVRFGSKTTFTTSPAGASILVDGVRVGATPFTGFVSAGSHRIELRKPDFVTIDETITVRGRAFFSLFVPRRQPVSAAMNLENGQDLLARNAASFSSWALYGEANSQYQFPPVLARSVQDFYTGSRNAGAPKPAGSASQVLASAVRDVQSPVLFRDYLQATALDVSAGRVLGPLEAGRLLQKIIQLEKDSQGFGFWIASVLGPDLSSKVSSSSWFKQFQSAYDSRVARAASVTPGEGVSAPGPAFSSPVLNISGVEYVRVPGGTFVMGREEQNRTPTDPLLLPHLAVSDSMYMMSTEVSRAEYARFVAANPGWAVSVKDSLVAKGLVDSSYLEGWTAGAPVSDPELPVTNVSFAAAEAFAQWVNESLPRTLASAGFSAHLPSETEWEYAAVLDSPNPNSSVFLDTYPPKDRKPQPVGTGSAGRLGISDLLGNVWEWTSDWYHPAAPALAPWPSIAAMGTGTAGLPIPAGQRTVKGGSWANRYDAVSVASRGSSPPDWCTPYLGFRLVLSRAH